MPVNHEVKGNLARLLATEDLVVEHRQVETAQFNVHTRVLTLPMWEKASNTVYDMLVGHEVGHALYTPDEDWLKEHKIPPQFVNIVEDARIEKLMKRRYAGLAKSFYNGYKELSDDDFFQLNDDDITTYNLADRVNLYFKIGNYVNVPFNNDEENDIVNMVSSAETFADVLVVAEKLYKYCKQEKQKEDTGIENNNLESQSNGSQIQSGSDFSDQQQEENDQENDNTGGYQGSSTSTSNNKSENADKKQSPYGDEDNQNDPEVKTVDSLEESLKQLIENDGWENVYIELPKVNLKSIIIPNSEIHKACMNQWNHTIKEYFTEVDTKYLEFKRSAQKEVNYLVKEFECRKSANSYSRSTVSRTGVLDCSKLHTYKYNDDLFKKVNIIPDGKNHGLIFILDWSGSMSDVLLDTIKQLFNLVWFCKKVSIPFEVYAFTSDWAKVTYDENNKAIFPDLPYEKKANLVQVHEQFSLMNLLTSKVNSKELEMQMKSIFRIAYSFTRFCYSPYNIPSGMSLSGTPLNESLICLHQIIPQFQKQNSVEKVQCVILTDGEACPIRYHREVQRHWEAEPYMGIAQISPSTILRDRSTGTTYSLDCEWWGITDVLIHNLRDKFKNTNFIGIRVLESRDSGSFIRRYCGYYGDEYDKTLNNWKKNKSFTIKNSGYQSYIALSASIMSQDVGFDVAESATKTQIKSAFVKSLRTKKMNKKILNEFVDLIA